MTVTVLPPLSCRAILMGQDDVIEVDQCLAGGLTKEELRWRVLSGRWQRPFPRVYVAHSGPLTRSQREWAGLLYAGAGAALCCWSAAARDGLRGHEPALVQVSVPVDRRLVRQPGLQVHVPGSLETQDVHARPRRTRMARSVIDIATRARTRDDARAVLAAAVQQRRATVPQLAAVVLRLGRVRYHRLILASLDDIAGGAHSLPELQFLVLVRRAGLPPPDSLQTPWRGGRRYLDATWEGVTVEIDGGQHREARQWWDDLQRQNEVMLDRGIVLRFPSHTIREHPERVVEQLRRALRQAGYELEGLAGPGPR